MSWVFLSMIFLPALVVFLGARFRSKPSPVASSVGDDISRNREIANFTAIHRVSPPRRARHQERRRGRVAEDRATKLVNVLWLESKRDPAGTEASTAQAYALESLYEAMRGLRAVLLTYVHVAFRRVDLETRDLVREVVDVVSQNGGCRGARSQLHLNVDNFAREALRLYPSAKRIYRASDTLKVAADVESLHHDERIWGPDALEFRPSRFAALTQDQSDAYMSFGVGKNTCPAANGFGNRAIASLVVVLLSRLGSRESGARVCFEASGLDRDLKAPLPTGRSDMERWVVSLGGMDDVEPRRVGEGLETWS
ncbi:hypothetical protein CSOJ01_08792 [Colletotrichum sojae]|uniref:Cytochrome P450 n=1 Tax=Colletotrichum sojae TaxID=2175907 RepID=A0A8H6MSF4_9PEZI|nr:hypothetical protein CSOJ01_08792 [Colletotrichum sojae]